MSFAEFKEKLLADPEFAKKFADIKSIDELVDAAAKEGYTFTAEDIKNGSELSDEEIESAAGGASVFIDGKNPITVIGQIGPVTIIETAPGPVVIGPVGPITVLGPN